MKKDLLTLANDIVISILLVSASFVYFTEGEEGVLRSIWFMMSATVLIVLKKD